LNNPQDPPPGPLWDQWISPETLLAQVRNTAPFLPLDAPETGRLIQLGAGPTGFLKILAAAARLDPAPLTRHQQLQDYFALCLACHHATVATFVPTDVDSKIRGVLWQQSRDPDVLRPLFDLTLEMMHWDLTRVSRRWLDAGNGPLSGHNGEQFSVLSGALGRFLDIGDHLYATRAADAIDAELAREAAAFHRLATRRNGELAALQAAISIAHNLGDLDQGISYWRQNAATAEARSRFYRLGHENTRPYGAAFVTPMRLYRDLLSAEGHRHYPLRAVRPLRASPDLLLPLAPFLDDWGGIAATHPSIDGEGRAAVLEALITGCRKVPNQTGYYRAVAGFREASPAAFERALDALPTGVRREARQAEFRKKIDVPRASFESMMRKRARAILDQRP